MYLRENRWEPLENLLEEYLKEIMKTGEPLEGILVFADTTKSVLFLAEKYGVPVISYEMGPIRPDAYRVTTSYFCFDQFFSTKEVESRYRNFLSQKIPLLGRQALLALLLSDRTLNYLPFEQTTPKYEIGAALSVALVVPYFANNMYMDMELVNDIKECYSESEILFRYHPYEPYRAGYNISKSDKFPIPVPFILKCARVAAVGSNILFETMLWGRTAYSKTNVTPMTYLCKKDYCAPPEECQDLAFLNFYAFCFLIPYNWRYDQEYIRWRCSGPSEQEIFDRHIQYYLSELGLNMNLLEKSEESQLQEILQARNRVDIYEEIQTDRLREVDYAFSELRLNTRRAEGYSYQETLYSINFMEGNTIVSRFYIPKNMSIESVRFIAEPYVTADANILGFESDASFVQSGERQLARLTKMLQHDNVIIADFSGASYLQISWRPSGKTATPNIQQLQADSEKLQELLNSRSWKITKPLRTLKAWVSKF